MKKILFSFFFFLFSFFFKAQNLVPNPSFEIITSCPDNINFTQILKAFPWFRPTGTSPDLFNLCATDNLLKIPKNAFGNQSPKSGNDGYAGLYVKVANNFREYIEVSLSNSLIKYKNYCINIYISLGDTCQWSSSAIGIYLSKDSLIKDTNSFYSPLNAYTPQIQNPAGNFITDKENWVPISGIYTAQGGERFITIGNFKDDANTPIQAVPGSQLSSYYYIDDVSVVELPEATELTGGNKVICKGDSVALGTMQKMNVSYSWSAGGGLSNEYIAQPYARPSVTTTYTLTVSDTSVVCANSSTAVVTVTVKQEVSLDAGRDTVVCEGKPVLLGTVAQPNCRYIWKPSTWLNDSTLAQPTTSPYGNITYYLSVSDTSFGVACTALKDSVKIYLKQDCPFPTPGKNSFYIPTAFSPNGDNNNDVLFVYGKNIEKLHLEIYNRWGEKVFETEEQSIGWDGTYKNQQVQKGVYAWYATVKFKDTEEKTHKGTFLLVK